MKSVVELILFLLLFLLGGFEVFYGAFWSRFVVTHHERFLFKDLQPLDFTGTQAHAFAQHFDQLKVQWGIVTIFGIVTIIIGIALQVLERHRHKKSHDA